jgi:hypothetical protein
MPPCATNGNYFENTKNTIASSEIMGNVTHTNSQATAVTFGVSRGRRSIGTGIASERLDRRFYGHISRALPYGREACTISPWTLLATLSSAADASLPAHATKR